MPCEMSSQRITDNPVLPEKILLPVGLFVGSADVIGGVVLKAVRTFLLRQRTLLRFSTASALTSLAGMVAGLVIIAWVPPEEMGVWKSLLIIQSYVVVVQGGISHGLNRELPFRIGAGDTDSVRRLAATAQSYSLAIVVLLFLGGLLSLAIFQDPMIRYALPAVFFAASTGTYVNYLSVTFRADQEFETLAKIQAAMAAVNIATLVVVNALGYFGIPLRLIVIGAINALLLHLFRPISVPLSFRWQDFLTLMKVGVPLFAVGWAIQVAVTFPNTILLFEAGTDVVGKFAPALAVFGVMRLVPKSISQYVYAKMSFRLGATGDLKALWAYAWKSSLGVLLLSVPVVIAVALAFPYLVRWFYPKYVDCISSAVWVAVAGGFFGAQLFSSALNSMKAWRWIVLFTVVRVMLSFVVPYVLVKVLPEAVGIMVAVGVGYAVAAALSFVVGLWCTYMATHARYEVAAPSPA